MMTSSQYRYGWLYKVRLGLGGFFFYKHGVCAGEKDEYRVEMLEEEKKKDLLENINQYNYLLGNFINKMEAKNEASGSTAKEEKEDFNGLKELQITKVRFVMIG